MHEEQFQKKSYGLDLEDLDPELFEADPIDLITKTVKEAPGRIALIFMDVKITFGKLDAYANMFAHMLIKNGFRKGDVVGINLPNIPEYTIAWLGTLKAGCISTGVSPLLSADEMKYQLKDGKARGLVTLDAIFAKRVADLAPELPDLKLIIGASVGGFLPKYRQFLGKLLKKLPSGKITPIQGKQVIKFEDIIRTGKYPIDAPNVKLTADDPAFIMYTGGTTGQPKGAVLTHRNNMAQILIATTFMDWDKNSGAVLSAFPMFHIAGLVFNELSVYNGWTQILLPDPRNTEFTCKVLDKYRPWLIANVPSLYYLLMADPKFKELDHTNLEQCISAASPFPVQSQKELLEIIGENKLIELYGMTETTAIAVINPARGEKRLGTVGLPMINTDIKIIGTETGELVPQGEAGELLVRCPHLMKEYYNQPEETANAIDAEGYLHTGDVVIQDADGYLTIVDRTKDMIIVSGFKVFSKKVEDVLATHPAVDIAATVGVPNLKRPGSEMVEAFVSLTPEYAFGGDTAALEKEIIAFAGKKLAPYEVPKVVHIRKELPLTSVGKLDKKPLRAEAVNKK